MTHPDKERYQQLELCFLLNLCLPKDCQSDYNNTKEINQLIDNFIFKYDNYFIHRYNDYMKVHILYTHTHTHWNQMQILRNLLTLNSLLSSSVFLKDVNSSIPNNKTWNIITGSIKEWNFQAALPKYVYSFTFMLNG